MAKRKRNEFSDYRNNVRRRARREINRLNKFLSSGKWTGQTRKAVTARVNELQQQIQRMTGRARTPEMMDYLREQTEKLDNMVPARGSQVGSGTRRTSREAMQEARNAAFTRQITIALHPNWYGEGASTLGKYAFYDARIFMQATQKYWMNNPNQSRMQAILEGMSRDLGRPVTSVEEAYNMTLALNRDMRRQIIKRERGYDRDGAMSDEYQSEGLRTDSDYDVTKLTIGIMNVTRW